MTEPRGHPWAWLLWLIAAGVSVLLTRNPWYLLLLSLEFALVARPDPAATAFTTSPLRLARSVIPLTAAFNALFSHTGTTVLLRLPDALPLLGGANARGTRRSSDWSGTARLKAANAAKSAVSAKPLIRP